MSDAIVSYLDKNRRGRLGINYLLPYDDVGHNDDY